MEPQMASVYSSSSVPRLRVARYSSTASNSMPSAQWPTDLMSSVSYPDSQTTSEDESGSLGPTEATPRLMSASLPPPDSTTMSDGSMHRLQAVMHRFETSSRTQTSASHSVMPPSPSEPDSDHIPPAQEARASIKVLVQSAYRQPGDTPQKPKLTRRASFNVMGSPKVGKSRRKSTSDEENEIFAKRHHDRKFDLSTAASMDRLRLELTESMPSAQAALSSSSASRPASEASLSSLKRAAVSHHVRDPKTSVIRSPVRHPKSHQDLEPYVVAGSAADNSPFPQQHDKHALSLINSSSAAQESASNSSHGNILTSDMPHSNQDIVPHESSRAMSAQSEVDYRERLRTFQQETDIGRERDWTHRKPPPPPARIRTSNHSHSSTNKDTGHVSPGTSHVRDTYTPGRLLRPESSAENSRPHSPGHDLRISSPSSSHSDHENSEEQHEIEHERERNWNASRPKWGQHSPHGGKVDTHHFPRTPSPLPPNTPGTSQNHKTAHSNHRTSFSTHSDLSEDGYSHSHRRLRLQHDPLRAIPYVDDGNDHSRTSSPSSSTSSRTHQSENVEELHERERGWNAPRPNGHQHLHRRPSGETDHHISRPKPSDPLAPSPSVHKEREQVSSRHRPNTSFEVPAHRCKTQSPSPTSTPRLHSSSSHGSSRAKSPAPLAHVSEALHPSLNIPHPPVNGQRAKENDAEPDHGKGRHSPKVSPSQRLKRVPSSPSPAPSRYESRASNPTSLMHTLSPLDATVRRPTSPGPTSPSELAPTSDTKKGHRRTITELSEATGPFPRKTTLPFSLVMPDEESDGSLFADESVPPPWMSTPTLKNGHLPNLSLSPAASDIPLPPSPPSSMNTTSHPSARADSDLARLQRAVASTFTFPTRHISPPEALALSTPPRRSSFNAQKFEFKTPSPPLGLPDLPDPPSSSEKEETSSRENGQVEPPPTITKTPRFPGAFGTPASAPIVGRSVEDVVSTRSDEAETTPKLEAIDLHQKLGIDDACGISDPTPAAMTPAPPGAYRATPTPLKRKGILKVRFDGDVPGSELVNGTGSTINGVISTTKVISPPPSPSSEDIPPLGLSPSRRKGLRLVDKYGRARRFTQDGEEIILDSRRKVATEGETSARPSPPDSVRAENVTITQRRRPNVRQVDALGNEILEERKQPNGEVYEARASRKAVFSRLTRSLGDLKDDLAEEEQALAASMPQRGPHDSERLMDLIVVSKTARAERNKLARKLQLERPTEDGVSEKVCVARNTALSPSEILTRPSWWRRKWRLALCLLILELAVLFMGYRLALVHAKQVWLTTYYDPFFPALYLRKTPPSFIGRFGTLPMNWSAFAISGTMRRVGVRDYVESVVKQLWEGIWNWRLEPWEAWGSPAVGPPVPQPWPPS